MKIRIIFTSLVTLLLCVLWVGTVSAQQSTPSDDDVNRIARQLFCPVCENTPLDVCPTQACAQWRALIREKLAAGWTDEQIKQYFVDQYGARVLSEPPRKGLNWLVYIVPVVLFAAGVVILARTFQSMRAPAAEELEVPSEAGQASAGAQDDYLSRFEEETRSRK